jgi:hypothetical protein
MSLKDMFTEMGEQNPVEEVPSQPVEEPQPTPIDRRINYAVQARQNAQAETAKTVGVLRQTTRTLQNTSNALSHERERVAYLQRQARDQRKPAAPIVRAAPRQAARSAPTLKPSYKIGRAVNSQTSVKGAMPRAGSFMGGGVPSSMPVNKKKSRRARS